ncbi:hypothetical protein ACPXCX_41550, partial [Streptomyces sp. DT225]
MRTNSTVRMSAPVEQPPSPEQPVPVRATTRGPSTRATRRSVRRCAAAKGSGSSNSAGQQLSRV